ncbi:MAG TPA: VCBS repeat-containing protein [Gemmatimonadaceae bacterium]
MQDTTQAAMMLPQGGRLTEAMSASGLTTYMLWGNRGSGAWGSWGMNGTTYQNDWTALYSGPISTDWWVVASADFTGDGQVDLVWQNSVTGDVGIWPMNGAVWNGVHVPLGAVPLPWKVAAAGDFTGDGKPDLVWQNVQTGERGIWVMNNTTFTGEYRLLYNDLVPTQWDIAAAADMNGDGKTDLVWQNTQTGERGVWLMNGNTYAGYAPLYNDLVPTNWDISAVADMTGDGKPDLVWTNQASGERGVWVMNGTTFTGEYRLLYQGNVDTQWQIAAILPVAGFSCTLQEGDTMAVAALRDAACRLGGNLQSATVRDEVKQRATAVIDKLRAGLVADAKTLAAQAADAIAGMDAGTTSLPDRDAIVVAFRAVSVMP